MSADGSPPVGLWAWPYGVVIVLALTLAWIVLPGGSGMAVLWLPAALAAGIWVSFRTWTARGRAG